MSKSKFYGQHIRSEINYLTTAVQNFEQGDLTKFGTSSQVVFKKTGGNFQKNVPYYLLLKIKPYFEHTQTIKVFLNNVKILETTVLQAELYNSNLSALKQEIAVLEREKTDKEQIRNKINNDLQEAQQSYGSALTQYEESQGDTNAAQNVAATKKALDNKQKEYDSAQKECNEVAGKLAAAESKLTSWQDNISITIDKFFIITDYTFNTIKIEVTLNDGIYKQDNDEHIDEVSQIFHEKQLFVVNDLIASGIIPTDIIRLGVQGYAGLKFVVNGNLLTVGNNNVCEIYDPHLVITSLGIIPEYNRANVSSANYDSNNFFLLDYMYEKEV